MISRSSVAASVVGTALCLSLACAGGGSTPTDPTFGPGAGGGNRATESSTAANTEGGGGSQSGGQATGNGPGDSDSGIASSGGGIECEDEDGDSFGEGCPAGPDCNDMDPQANPGLPEQCDAVDHNCDGDAMAGCECPDDGVGGDCNTPEMLGELGLGQVIAGVVGNVPGENGLDWYQAGFPIEVRPGAGTPTIDFAVNEGGVFVFDVVTSPCATEGAPCMTGGADGGFAVGLTSWSFVDDDPGCCAPPSDSMQPWPSTVYIRVYRTDAGASCAAYQLQISR